MHGNKSTTYQNLWDTENTKVQRKFRAENVLLKKNQFYKTSLFKTFRALNSVIVHQIPEWSE